MSFFDDIKEFHEKFGLAYNGPPRLLPDDLWQFRLRCIQEEVNEYAVADTKAEQLDALVDLAYFAIGTAYIHGFDFNEAWRRVHEANMTKIRARQNSDSKRGSTHDVVKPANFVPADLSDLTE